MNGVSDVCILMMFYYVGFFMYCVQSLVAFLNILYS